MSQINEDLRQLKEQETKSRLRTNPGKNSPSKLKLVALDPPATKPNPQDKNYMKPTRMADARTQIQTEKSVPKSHHLKAPIQPKIDQEKTKSVKYT